MKNDDDDNDDGRKRIGDSHGSANDDDYDSDALIFSALKDLDAKLEGSVLFKEHAAFPDACRVWRQDQESIPPLAVIEVHTEADVSLAIPVLAKLKEDHSLPFRIRSGGHNKAGFSTVANGVVLSLAKMNKIRMGNDFFDAVRRRDAAHDGFDPSAQQFSATVNLQSGALVRDFMEQVQGPFRYGGVIGVCRNVAESGFVLGGGFGFLSRKYGLGCDSVKRMRVVLADGTAVDATDELNSDLFWAMRGAGGGSFGVMVDMDYVLHPINDQIITAMLKIPMKTATSLLRRIGQMNIQGRLSRDFAMIYGGYEAPLSSKKEPDLKDNIEGNALFLIFWVGEKSSDGVEYIENQILRDMQTGIDITYEEVIWSQATFPKGSQWGTSVYAAQAWTGHLYPHNNTDQVWNDIQCQMEEMFRCCPDLMPDVEVWGGAINDVLCTATAFGRRQIIYNVGVTLMLPSSDEEDDRQRLAEKFQAQVSIVNEIWPSIAKHLQGVYVNYPMSSLSKDEYASAYWGDNLSQLLDIKRKYDPNNVFSYEQSVPLNNED